jgi:hypothetical protein
MDVTLAARAGQRASMNQPKITGGRANGAFSERTSLLLNKMDLRYLHHRRRPEPSAAGGWETDSLVIELG